MTLGSFPNPDDEPAELPSFIESFEIRDGAWIVRLRAPFNSTIDPELEAMAHAIANLTRP